MRTPPNPGSDPEQALPAAIAREIFASLCASLPPPVADTPEARDARDEWAMQSVAALRPADAFEARLAVDVVAADAMDCLRLAARSPSDVSAVLRCRAQASVMMRQMQSALRTLQRMQATRQNSAAASAPGENQPTQPTAPRHDASPATRPDPLTAAENYAVLYPIFAARIRASGGLAGLDPAITPPDPAIVEALVNGTSLLLCALDQIEPRIAQPPDGIASHHGTLSHASIPRDDGETARAPDPIDA